jgi:cell division septum initiation protein DivIVA
MPRKKSTVKKYTSSHYPKPVREAARTFGLAKKVRRQLGEKARGKPKSSKIHKDYVKSDRAYQQAGSRLARLTGHKWS